MQSSPRLCGLLQLAAAVAAGMLIAVAQASAASAPQKPQMRSAASYRDHLQSLDAVLGQCRQHTDAAHCNVDAVGADDQVMTPGQSTARLVQYAWLRAVLAHVGDAQHPLPAKEAGPLLAAAATRLQLEQAQAPGASIARSVPRTAEQAALHHVLAREEFRQMDRSLSERVSQAIALWINRRLFGLAQYSAHRRWLGQVLVWGLVSAACLGLAFWCVRQTRRARGLSLGDAMPLDNAPAMRDWQRWREQAEQAAGQQRWREAVHGFYWAAIARMESRGQWPADRARTPREYLRLLLPEHPKHRDLRLLTHRFEGCWYGSSIAAEPDCDAARQLFERLVSR